MREIDLCVLEGVTVFKNFDTLLRCGICYEYMKTAMMTACSHNYCSLCIRKSLLYKQQCPTCFDDAFESQLRNNRILDDIIALLCPLTNEIEKHRNRCKNCPVNRSPESEINKENKQLSNLMTNLSEIKYNSVYKKSMTNNSPFKKVAESISEPTTSSFVSEVKEVNTSPKEIKNNIDHKKSLSTNLSLKKDEESLSKPTTSSFVAKVKEENIFEADQDVSHLQNEEPATQQTEAKPEKLIPSMFTPKKKDKAKTNAQTINFVPCPVCSVDIPERNINIHLDACLKRSEQAQEGSPKKEQKRRPLPKLVYSLLQDRELKKRLKDLGLSTQGDRRTLVSRHQRYTLLYNSECDSVDPKSPADIIQQIEREEKEEKKVSNAGIPNVLKINRKTDPKQIEEANREYIQQNKNSYDELIQSIKHREQGKKASVRSNVILSDDEEDQKQNNAEDPVKNPQDEKVIVTPLRNCISDDDDDATDISNSPKNSPERNKIDNSIEIMDETTHDVEYEGNTYEQTSPVLGRNPPAVSSRFHITPDMFDTQAGNENDSNESFSLLPPAQVPVEVAPSTGFIPQDSGSTYETQTLSNSNRLNSQILDPNFEPSSSEEATEDFVMKRPRSKRKAKKQSTPSANCRPTGTGTGRVLRKRAKH